MKEELLGPVVGITYFGRPGSIIKNNDIHNLTLAFIQTEWAISL